MERGENRPSGALPPDEVQPRSHSFVEASSGETGERSQQGGDL
jgi:hypothetical protein